MRYFIVLILTLMPCALAAQDWEDQRLFGAAGAEGNLRLISSTDTSFFAPIIESFLRGRPNVSISYFVTGTADLDAIFRADPDGYDVVISSAMDLQLKLANDGFALRIDNIAHPAWAQWRQSLFGFTTEPATIVVNKAAFAGLPIPRTRQELIQALRADPDRFRGRVGTYDVRQSGLGYLFATQDSRASESFWRLTEVMGSLDAQLYCCSGEMIDDLTDGTLAVAYNVLGSYASARNDALGDLEVILPSDFPTTMMRTAFVSESTVTPLIAADFIRHLTVSQSDTSGSDVFPLPPLTPRLDQEGRAAIALEPALMTYLDRLKRRTFLREWESAIIQTQD
jgi:iron(III) transport system substrate-binding protein